MIDEIEIKNICYIQMENNYNLYANNFDSIRISKKKIVLDEEECVEIKNKEEIEKQIENEKQIEIEKQIENDTIIVENSEVISLNNNDIGYESEEY
jgi:hypothetical protein